MIFFGIFILSLAVGGIVTSSIGVSYRSHSYYSCSNYKSGYCYSGYYVYYYSRKAVSWVGFGLGSAALLVGLICSIYSIFEYRKLNRPAKAPKKALFKPQEKRVSSVDSSDIIESIQKLKILLDSGAISQEEFELLKKDKLSKL